MNELINNKDVRITAPATPCLLNIYCNIYWYFINGTLVSTKHTNCLKQAKKPKKQKKKLTKAEDEEY